MKFELFPPLSIFELGQRSNQEDAIYPDYGNATVDTRLFVLCDGMGGHEQGELASQTACKAFGEWFCKNVSPNDSFVDEQFNEALSYVYSELDKYDSESIHKMGTTMTLLYFHRGGVYAAHIGDSRIYHIRPTEGILYLSRDHSIAVELFQAGEISYEEIKSYPRRNIVTRAMMPGDLNRMRPDIIHITDIKPDDYFYMCSDGMMEHMTDDEFCKLLSSQTSDDKKRQHLINFTKSNQDNHSAWLIRVKDVIIEEGDNLEHNEEKTSVCNFIHYIPSKSHKTNDVTIVREKKISFLRKIQNLFK